ncbi:MAG TPA: YPO3983 family protein [Scandinavium sp.]|jgi:uncharacterized protein (TIGR03034 family)|uniref:YPO3983 family protein n=1 Tax=Scandinavium sp. TaxID=2830653 RepID=UPI002E381AE3|nr:YPO3983 family protein [Scandinavium sp.]HEX4503120.1 YPO3983 family protein [Scandinavium sp.]
MQNNMLLSMYLPCTVFETKHKFNDTEADDMQFGDMDEQQLRTLGLDDISAKVDPYNLICYDHPKPQDYSVFDNNFYHQSVRGRKISHEECVHILFDEMKELSSMFSFWGEYSYLIGEMIDHLHNGNGSSFSNGTLNLAFKRLVQERGIDSPLSIITNNIDIEFGKRMSLERQVNLLDRIKRELFKSRLPKFNRATDRFNGLGITIHDVNSQRIKIISIHKHAMGWDAWVQFDAQDHFGLDVVDIRNPLYRNFRFFRIWFFLQRHRDFAFKPFFTNFNASIMVKG